MNWSPPPTPHFTRRRNRAGIVYPPPRQLARQLPDPGNQQATIAKRKNQVTNLKSLAAFGDRIQVLQNFETKSELPRKYSPCTQLSCSRSARATTNLSQ